MAPVKGKGGPVKKGGNKPKNPTAAAPKGKTASKVKKPVQKAVEQKTKAPKHGQVRKKKRVYTDKELNIPKLNSIVPAGIQKPNGVKKGKTFVDDQESMMDILALVQAEKEGNIESKMMKARQMEEIREARKAEQEKKELGRKQKLEETKDEIRHRKRTNTKSKASIAEAASEPEAATKPKKKRVSFG